MPTLAEMLATSSEDDEPTDSMLEVREAEALEAYLQRLRVEDPVLHAALERSRVTPLTDYPTSRVEEAERLSYALHASVAGEPATEYPATLEEEQRRLTDAMRASSLLLPQAPNEAERVPFAPPPGERLHNDEVEMEVSELQEGAPLASPAESAAAAEQASRGAPPVVVGTVLDRFAAGYLPRLYPMQKMLGKLNVTPAQKYNAELRWMELGTAGFVIDAHKRSDHFKITLRYTRGGLSCGPGVLIMERMAPSLLWIEEFNVRGASSQKDAKLLAKLHIHRGVESIRIARTRTKIDILRAPGGVLDPNDKTRMITWWGDWDPLNDDAGEA